MQLKATKFGLAGGILWGTVLFLTTVLSVYTGYAAAFLDLMASIYPGYSISLAGSVMGLIYGFIDGFVGLYLLAWLYNKLNR